MEWINLHVRSLDSDAFKRSRAVDQGTWLKLLRYCAGQENGGCIKDCRDWTDKDWQIMVGSSLGEVSKSCGLWKWEGNDLILSLYPVESELRSKKLRESSAKGNAVRWQKENAKPIKPESPGESPGDSDSTKPESPGESRAISPGDSIIKDNQIKDNQRERGALAPASDCDRETNIPTLEECLMWGARAGVPDDWIRSKFANTTGTHGWVKNRRLILWQVLWKTWFEDDRITGKIKKNGAAPEREPGTPPPAPGLAAVNWDMMRA